MRSRRKLKRIFVGHFTPTSPVPIVLVWSRQPHARQGTEDQALAASGEFREGHTVVSALMISLDTSIALRRRLHSDRSPPQRPCRCPDHQAHPARGGRPSAHSQVRVSAPPP